MTLEELRFRIVSERENDYAHYRHGGTSPTITLYVDGDVLLSDNCLLTQELSEAITKEMKRRTWWK